VPLKNFWSRLLHSPAGWIFRQTFARRARAVVLGSRYSQLTVIVDAVEALTRMLVASLAEDPYGKVQAEVPLVVRTFTNTILAIEAFMKELPVDSTDVYFDERSGNGRKVEEVELLLSEMKRGLAELLSAFQLYLSEVGLTAKDLRLARLAATVPKPQDGSGEGEMEQVR